MNYDEYVDDKKKKKKKKKDKENKEKEEKKAKEEKEIKKEVLEDNPYKDYYKKYDNVDIEIDDILDKPKKEKDEVIIESKNEIKRNKTRSNTLFYTVMGIIFGLLIIFVGFMIIYKKIKK